MNNEWLNAYVLHRRPYRETSYIVDFFTLEEGRVSAVAKGVKNSKSDKKSLLQPFQHLRLQLSGKSELKNLRHVESVSPSINLVGTALFCAMYVNELTNRVMPAGLASDGVHNAYENALLQKQTQVMNEGWATFWHYTILNHLYDEGKLTDSFMLAQTKTTR